MFIKVKKTVAVAMSGGVDSSVGAMILKERGYRVIGVSMHLFNAGSSGPKTCCSVNDILDAKKVCVKTGMPHFVINLEEEFRASVINPFVSEYINGKTPNPCILCNRALKFDILLKRVKELGAQFLATGHYARIAKNKNGAYFLLKARDIFKDQSYVLYNLTQDNLKNIMFPVGNLSKESARKIASAGGFKQISAKKESMEICFIPEGNYAEFIKKQVKFSNNKGFIKNLKGEILGEHNGIFGYTIGQRKGLGLSSKLPFYVTKISADTNEIFIGTIENCYNNELYIKDVNLIDPGDKNRLGRMDLTVKIRYSSPNYKCRAFVLENDIIKVSFEEPVKFITPGQSAVLYSGPKVIGGGVISQ
ncbi:MAG: tRNA 2-thiouridine(34) synthase MnmA [Deltaproteobacteria bacterium]|nr:tRNA 2-thiouridine(34) synthase MnmA [Deltaproteobacteria bacterium]